MKVLISAYACEPGRGSEPGVGWNLVRELSHDHELWVITRANNRPAIEAGTSAWGGNVHWIFVDPPRWLTFWKSGGRGLAIYYAIWQRCALRAARGLKRTVKFDIVHHLTFGSVLPASPLASLGIPFVCGPLGGGESIPPALLDGYDARTRWKIARRAIVRGIMKRLPGTRKVYQDAAWCLAANQQTQDWLEEAGAKWVSILPQSGIGDEEISRFSKMKVSECRSDRPLELVAASRLVYWKAIDLVIDAVALAVTAGLDVRLTVLQEGPEKLRLLRQVGRLGLEGRVTFAGRLSELDEVYRRIAAADALVHPAFQEAFGQVCLESLALGVPVICLDWAGPGMIVDPVCGYKVRPGTRDQVVTGLSQAMGDALRDRHRRHEIATAAKNRAERLFHWIQVAGGVRECYRQALRKA